MKIAKAFPLLILAASLLLSGCGNSAPKSNNTIPLKEFNFNFESGTEGWLSSFLGYDESNKDAFDFQSTTTTIPDLGSQGLMLSADNPNGQLVMYAQKQLSGLEAQQDYNLLYRVGLGSNVSSSTQCAGFAGKRTEVKISASVQEPKEALEENLELLDLGISSYQRIGVVGHKDRNCEATDYAINQISNIQAPFNAPVEIKSDANGQVWAVVVLDSSYVGKSTFYLDSIDITATPVSD